MHKYSSTPSARASAGVLNQRARDKHCAVVDVAFVGGQSYATLRSTGIYCASWCFESRQVPTHDGPDRSHDGISEDDLGFFTKQFTVPIGKSRWVYLYIKCGSFWVDQSSCGQVYPYQSIVGQQTTMVPGTSSASSFGRYSHEPCLL